MEDKLREIQSPLLEKTTVKKILQELSAVVTEAAALRDQQQLENPDMRKALTLVEGFLRKKHRLCYGGMAINAHLMKSHKFYDFSKVLPDYDFFSPEPEKDVDELMAVLESNGLSEVSSRLGIHEGTFKVFVNFTSVADITFLPPWLFSLLSRRRLVDDGISYVDADFLRMNMYLELSRPRGEVERWDKVYKRLVLLNLNKPPHITACKGKRPTRVPRVPSHVHEELLHVVAENKLTFVGPDVKRLYSSPKSNKAGYILKSQHPIVVYAENPDYYVPIFRQLIHDALPNQSIHVSHWNSYGDFTPEAYGIKANGTYCIVLLQEDFCHGYNLVQLQKGSLLHVATLDTAITTWYQLSFLKGLESLVNTSIHCFADALVDISIRTRDKGLSGAFPAFSTSCQGHQPSKASLLRAKEARVQSMKRRKQLSSTTRRRPRP
jgi:hypothetical protein